MNKEKLSAPWDFYYRQLTSLLEGDPAIHIGDLEQKPDGVYFVQINVDDTDKAKALKAILVSPVEFGNVSLELIIFGPEENKEPKLMSPDLVAVELAFTGNPLLHCIIKPEDPEIDLGYCVLKKKVLQFYCDNIADYRGNYSGLPAQIADDICVSISGVYFCTEADE